MEKLPTFEEELTDLIGKYCKQEKSNTPDFILAKYLERCLSTFEDSIEQREDWYGVKKKAIW